MYLTLLRLVPYLLVSGEIDGNRLHYQYPQDLSNQFMGMVLSWITKIKGIGRLICMPGFWGFTPLYSLVSSLPILLSYTKFQCPK